MPPKLRRPSVPVPTQSVSKGASVKSEIDSQSQDKTALPSATPPALNPVLSTTQEPLSKSELIENFSIGPATTPLDVPAPTASVPPIAEFATQGNSTGSESVVAATHSLKPETKLVIDGVRPGRGPVKVAIYTKSSDFPNPTSATQAFELSASESTIEIPLPMLGRFAVGVFQDINSDGELNRNRLGIPTEPFAFSNNAIGQRGPPSYDQAAVVQSTDAPFVVAIKLP